MHPRDFASLLYDGRNPSRAASEFTPDAFKEYNQFILDDFELVQNIVVLIRAIQNDPFKGLGKPEPLKG